MPVDHYENFPVASLLLPARLREPVEAIYAFARSADDIADEGDAPALIRLAHLNDYRNELNAIERGEAPRDASLMPIFARLASNIRAHKLPLRYFRDLLDAFSQDVGKTRYADFAELVDYCRRSADPVGRIVLMIHGYRDPELFRLSDRICTALQVANFLQDVGVDLKKDRIYLPEEDFRQCGYSEADLRMGVVNERFRNLMKLSWKRTRALFEEGKPLPAKLAWPLSWEIKLTWLGGMDILRKTAKLGFDTLHQRPALDKGDWPRLVWGMLTS